MLRWLRQWVVGLVALKEGRDSVTFTIKRLMDEYAATGSIGNVAPRDKKHALRVAKAVAMAKAQKGK